MGKLFYIISTFFSKHRLLFFSLLGLLLTWIIWMASRLQFEEDIYKVIPTDKKIEKYSSVLQHSKFSDQLILDLFATDSLNPASPAVFMAYADELADSIVSKDIPVYVKEVQSKISDSLYYELYGEFYQNLPLFLEPVDYNRIDSLLSEESIKITAGKNYRTLLSPASLFLKDYIIKDPLSFTSLALKRLQTFQVEENYQVIDGYIFSRDRKHLLIFITPSNPSTETAKNGTFLKRLDNLTALLTERHNGQVRAEYFGPMAIAVSNAVQIKKDIYLTLSIAVVVLILFISLYFRNKVLFLMIFMPALLGGGLALAMLFLIKAKISAVSLGFGAVMLGISVNVALHYIHHARKTGNLHTIINDLSTPVIVSSLTTSGAFLCLLLVRSEVIQVLGLFAAISILGAAIFTLIIFPQFPALARTHDPEKTSFVQKITDRIALYEFHRNKLLIAIVLICTVVFLFSARSVKFESDMSALSYVSPPLKKAEATLDKIGNYTLRSVFIVSSGKDLNQALLNEERLVKQVEKLNERGLVKKFSSVSSLMMSDSLQAEKIRKWNTFWAPQKIGELKSNLIRESKVYGFKETAFDGFFRILETNYKPVPPDSLPQIGQLVQGKFITFGNSQTSVTTILKVRQEDKQEIYKTLQLQEDNFIFDKEFLTSNFIRILEEDFNTLLGVSVLIVFSIILFSFGRIELTVLTFIPMTLSWIWTLGIMGLLGIKLTIFNTNISVFVFGLGDDYSIFLMQGFLQQYKYGKEKVASYKISILLSAITTIVGVGVLIFARHPALKSMAISNIIGMLSVILITYTLGPLLFRWLIYYQNKKRTIPITFKNLFFSMVALMIFLIGSLILTISGFVLFYLVPLKKKRKESIFHYWMMVASRFIVFALFNIRKKVINPEGEDFRKPAVIISNHQSHIDLVLLLMLCPKMIILTNEWVQRHPVYGKIVHFADFYPLTEGLDKVMDKLRSKVSDGYSILVFPEGTRSPDLTVKRFHQGAFYIADKLGLEILPVVIHGSGHCMVKGEPFLKSGSVSIRIFNRMDPGNPAYGQTLKEKAKYFRQFYKEAYRHLEDEFETPGYFHEKLVKNYIYKGPVLEWYLRIKLRTERNYRVFHEQLPSAGKITDIGCGYGFMSYMLHFLGPEREITGVDFDPDKIDVANNCLAKNDHVRFDCADVMDYPLSPGKGFILSDVLHYIPENDQEILITRCIENLEEEGILIIRDADRAMRKKHLGTKLSEYYSTHSGFNKTRNNNKDLFFTSKDKILSIASKYNMNVRVIDETRYTSNLIFIMKRKRRIDND
jgi:1-acyl-sn-glycerol-3-phosphate acyltransferase